MKKYMISIKYSNRIIAQVQNSQLAFSLQYFEVQKIKIQLFFTQQIKVMQNNNEELPDYKKTFLYEMDELRRQEFEQYERAQLAQTGMSNMPNNQPKVQPENNILNTSQYSSADWRQNLTMTTTQQNHDLSHHNLNLLMNPEVGKKQNNIRSTQISEYSNARHNNTVFVNPKNTSC